METAIEKLNILVVGFGGLGTITALNLEASNLATVTGVLRSNYDAVEEHGFNIWSIDHGHLPAWRPTNISKAIPDINSDPSLRPFDYIVLCTKNIPTLTPPLPTLLTPAVTPSYTTILLLQNGLNIELPFLRTFPTNLLLSATSECSATTLSPTKIYQQDHDRPTIGAFRNPNIPLETQQAAAKKFCDLYNAGGKATAIYAPDVKAARWRKLAYNAGWNGVCTVTGMDMTALKVAKRPIDELVVPVMREVLSVGRAAGVELEEGIVERALVIDPYDGYFRPSMLQDNEKDNFMEVENIVGEPFREAQRLGVSVPVLSSVYSILVALQEKTKQRKGMVEMPPLQEHVESESLAKFRAATG